MPLWSLSLAAIESPGRAYALEPDPDDAPSAFVVHLRSRAPGSVAHPDGGFLVAFGAACTHMGCSLVGGETNAVKHRLPTRGEAERLTCGPCPCHGTTFDLTRRGLVVLGPATQNLPQLELAVRDDGGARRVVAERFLTADPRLDAWPFAEAS